jgi:hypothetical protein
MDITQQNGRQPAVPRLPDDILLNVFGLCMPNLAFSHVCRAWRALALDTPSLWTTIDFRRDGPSRALEQLRRSRDAPLLVTFAGDRKRSTPHAMDSHVSAYLARLPSIRALTFDGADIRDVERLSWHKDPAPALELFSISFSALLAKESHVIPPCIILDAGTHLFGGRARCLRELLLEDCHIVPVWHPYTNLRALTLNFRMSKSIGLNRVLAVLSAAPMLERLHSHYIVTDSSDDLDLGNFSATRPLELKYLKQWTISEYIPFLAELLPCLRLPSLTMLAVTGPCDDLTKDLRQLLDGLATELLRMQNRFSASFVSLSADHTPGVYVSAQDGGPEPWLTIELEFEERFLDFYIVACRYLPFESVTRLEMPGNAEFDFSSNVVSGSTWHAVLDRMPALELLRSRGMPALELCGTLLEYPDLCPRLRDLSFVDVQLPRSSGNDGTTLLERIAQVISSRRVRGSPLARFGVHEMLPRKAVALRHALDARGIHADLGSDNKGSSGMQLWINAEDACLNDVWSDLHVYV